MASFSVDITDIKFAGGRTGYKVVKISNAPAAGIGISNTGYGNYFRLIEQDSNYYRISTKFVNTSGSSYTSYIRFYNRNDSSDYVVVDIEQYSVSDIAIYGDGVYDSGSPGFYGLDVGYSMGSSSVYIDSYNGEGVSGTVTSGESWLSCVSGTPAVTDTGFISYNLAYITNYDSSRTGEVYFETGTSHYNLTLTVYQAGDAPVERLYVSPSSLSFTASGGTKAIDVIQYRGSTLNYDMTEVSSWASVSLSQVMTGVMTGSVTTAVNASTSQRTGSIWFSDVSGSISLPIAQNGQAVTLSASPSSLSFTSGGGTKTLAVTFAGDLNSNAANMPSWLSQSYVSVDSSHRTYTVQASSNDTSSSRSFSWVFQDDNMELTVPVTQLSSTPSGWSVSPATSYFDFNYDCRAKIDSEFETIVINHPAGQGFSYDVTGQSGIVTVSQSSVSSTRDELILDIPNINNRMLSVLSADINIYNQSNNLVDTVTITQSGLPSDGSATAIVAYPEGLVFGGNDFTVSGSSYYEYLFVKKEYQQTLQLSVVSGSEWLKCELDTSEPRYNIYRVYVNSSNIGSQTELSGLLRFSTYSKSTDVPVEAYVNENSVFWMSDPVDPLDSSTFYDGDGETRRVVCRCPYNMDRTLGSGSVEILSVPSWADVKVIAWDDRYPVELDITARENNTGSTRTGTVTLGYGNIGSVAIPVKQAAKTAPVQNISVTPSVINVGIAAATDVVTLNYISGSYRYESTDWLSLSHLDDPSAGNTRYTLNIAANTGVSQRTGQIDFISESGYGSCSLVVNQAGNDEMTVTPSTVSFSSSGGSGSVQVYYVSGGYMNVTAGLHPDWVTNFGVGSAGSYKATFMFDVTANSGVNRYGYVHINNTYNSKSCRFLVTQTGSGPSFSVSPSSLSFSAAGGAQTISFTGIQTSGLEYEIVSGSDWLGFSFSDNKVLADTNTGSARTGSIRFRNNLFSSDYVTITVSQAAGSGPAPVVSGLTVDKDFVVLRRGDFGNNSDYLYFNKSGLSYDVFYTDGSGWLSVNITGSTAYIQATDNSGVSRNARIKFYTSSSDYVYVNVVQASGTYIYIPIWQDYYYRPADYQVGEDYHYRLVDHSNNKVLFEGITVAKSTDDYDDYIDDINIPRLIENYVSSGENSYGEQIDNYSGYWSRLNGSIEVDFYNADTDQLIDSFKFFNDWSDLYYEDYQKYGLIDYNKTLNDPINFKGCQYMEIPFCVYDDSRTRSYSVGNISLGTLPEDFCVYTNNAYTGNKVDFKRGSTVLFSYDLRHCGNGYLVYRNRFGGWDSFLIEGNISKKESYNRDNYTKKADNISSHRREKFTNSNSIVTSYEFSTGWLSEEESERFVYHLLSSPSVSLYVLDDCMINYRNGGSGPGVVTITNTDAEYKKFKNGRRLVNYTVSVDVAYKTKVQR